MQNITGVLIECDPSIKAIIEQIDSERNDFIYENLSDELVVIKESKLDELKIKLEQVCVENLTIVFMLICKGA